MKKMNEKKITGFDLHRIENLGIEKVVSRGTAEILEHDEDGIFVYDTISEAYMISCEDTKKAKQWILKHENRDYGLMVITGKALRDFAKEQYGFANELECYQLAYLKTELDLVNCDVDIRKATMADLEFILKNYDILEEEELTRLILAEKIILAECNGKPAGFIGEHLEGSIGLLFVLPEYRNRGIATYLEQYKMKDMLDKGYIPFGQVVVGNEKSLKLQQKLGLEESRMHVYWLF